ncbi:MAG: LEA type 2 family protein [Pseudomonas sp.]|nr:LEA type 2 family protein [Pseudomonas sp.]
MKSMHWMLSLALIALLSACASGPVRRVSEPAARIQQLTVQASGGWSVELRLENFSSVPMRFDAVDIAVAVADQAAGNLQARPGVTIGPESADVITVALQPSAGAKLAVADALSAGRGLPYALTGKVDATPDQRGQRSFEIKRSSTLSPAPGLPGVLR